MFAPTPRAYLLAALGLIPAGLAIAAPWLLWVSAAIDVAVLLAVVIDGLRGPPSISAQRVVAPVISSGLPHRVGVTLRTTSPRTLRGMLRDEVDSGPLTEGTEQPFVLEGECTLHWQLTPLTRGDLRLDDIWLRVESPWRLATRDVRISAAQTIRVFPDVAALARDALQAMAVHDDTSRRIVPLRAEGREFESLREYRPGDDRRTIDWKATARRGRTIVRQQQPERNQTVLVLIDCGRHMAGAAGARRKIDCAVDAAMRLASVSLHAGDQVGVMAYAQRVRSWLPPRKGHEHLKAIAHALYRVDATLDESDIGAALDLAFSRSVRRALVVVLTDVLDLHTAKVLVARTQRLTPRHVPLIASLRDDDVHALATSEPTSRREAYERFMASRLDSDVRATVARLRDAGAHVIHTSPDQFGADTAAAYLDLKARGRL